MAELVTPFRGWRYNLAQAGDMTNLVAPPYDVINLAQQAEYCLRSPYNIVRLDLGEPGGPGPGDARRYEQASRLLAAWQQERVLVRDPRPCFYLYEEQYRDPLGEEKRQRGFIGAVRLHDYEDRVILPHEGTLKGPKIDRLALMQSSHTAFSQIFAMYTDAQRTVEQVMDRVQDGAPYFDLTDAQSVRHRMWVISEPEEIAALSAALDDKQIVIADGHHRYETALAYRNKRRAIHGSTKGPWERVSMFLANTMGNGLTILAAHRMLEHLPPGTASKLSTCVARPFEIVNLVLPPGNDAEVAHTLIQTLDRWGEEGAVFVAYLPERRAHLLLLRKQTELPPDYGQGHSETWRRLDVAILHELVISGLLGLSGTYAESGQNVSFTRYAEEALALVEAGKQEMALLLNPTGVEQVMAIAAANDRMPQKGTYFYPKLLAGTVLYDLATD
ncbi:MAG: DUF1015 domain-containing protein [candidate division WS1 bacterium]|nr:DUF1015 domain-containing protein [candidate division WS1 bacterium]